MTQIEEDEKCGICLEYYYNIKCEKETTPCLHTFCKNCLDDWRGIVTTCPICRKEIPKSLENVEREYSYYKETLIEITLGLIVFICIFLFLYFNSDFSYTSIESRLGIINIEGEYYTCDYGNHCSEESCFFYYCLDNYCREYRAKILPNITDSIQECLSDCQCPGQQKCFEEKPGENKKYCKEITIGCVNDIQCPSDSYCQYKRDIKKESEGICVTKGLVGCISDLDCHLIGDVSEDILKEYYQYKSEVVEEKICGFGLHSMEEESCMNPLYSTMKKYLKNYSYGYCKLNQCFIERKLFIDE